MYGKLLKTLKHSMKKGRFWEGAGDKTILFLHEAIINLTCCNIMIFIIYMPVFSDTFI